MSIAASLEGIGNFFAYFGVSILAEALFLALYMALTPHREIMLIRKGNTAAAVSLGGAVLGFTLPIASAAISSVSLVDMAVWSVIATVVQLAAFLIVSLLLRGLASHIEEGNLAAGVTVATASLAIGMINAASMSY
jgi:putative membrane protein